MRRPPRSHRQQSLNRSGNGRNGTDERPILISSDSDSSSDSDDLPDIRALNISNDEYYKNLPKPYRALKINENDLAIPKYGSPTIRHTKAAYDLWSAFYPTHLKKDMLLNLHRPMLHYLRWNKYDFPFESPVKNLALTMCRYQKRLRHRITRAANAGVDRAEIQQMLRIYETKDLTAKKGELYLFEYSEQCPPVLSQIGMSSNIKSLIAPSDKMSIQDRRKLSHNQSLDQPDPARNNSTKNPSRSAYGYEEVVQTKSTSKPVYYNSLRQGSRLQVIENNMYRAPIFEHEFPHCDFLVIKTNNSLYVRQVQTIFTVGQTLPLVAIPTPNHRNIGSFRCRLSNRHIHRLFKTSDTNPPSVPAETILKLFPDISGPALHTRLYKQGITYTMVNKSKVYFQGESRFGRTTELSLRNLLTPEQFCLDMAMLSARERLRELNYTETMILPPTNDVEMETEVLAAPWNTTRAVHGAQCGRHYLDFRRHLIDPTGPQREGFSCVPWSKSPTEEQLNKDRSRQQAQSNPQSNATQVPSKTPIFAANPNAFKIKREKLERLAIYQKEAQIIAQVQADALSSKEQLSSEEDCDQSDDEDEIDSQLDVSLDEQVRDLDKLVMDGKTSVELSHDKEEEERLQMLKEFQSRVDVDKQGAQDFSQPNEELSEEQAVKKNANMLKNRVLKITRTYDTPDGKIQRTELVRESRIIALYVSRKGDDLRQALVSTSSPKKITPMNRQNCLSETRRNSNSLGPKELCRTEGTKLTISKRVLDTRAMRKIRRMSAALD